MRQRLIALDYISMQTGRPLLKVSAKEMNPSFGVGPEFSKWFSLTERWNALLVFDHAEFSMFRPYSRETEQLGKCCTHHQSIDIVLTDHTSISQCS